MQTEISAPPAGRLVVSAPIDLWCPKLINQVTWTLELEVIFYILAPWITLIYRLRGNTLRWSCQLLLIVAVSCFVHYWLLPFGPPLSYYSFKAALPWFLSGILLADLYVSGLLSRSNHPAWDALALLGLAAFLICNLYGPAWQSRGWPPSWS